MVETPPFLLAASTRREWLKCCGVLSFLALGIPKSARAAEPQKRLMIVPLGPTIANADVEFVARSLRAFYNFEPVVAVRQPLPRVAFYRPRQRYRAEKLLDFLETRLADDVDRVVGLTSVDISTTKGDIADWGILGLATIDGRVCIISSFRCRRRLRKRDDARIRLGKVAVHEIGHTLGLQHCPSPGCLMRDAEGSVLTVDDEYDLCARCRDVLSKSDRLSNAGITAPWPS
jgi:archaemetzincin